jgi:hypothetical protein
MWTTEFDDRIDQPFRIGHGLCMGTSHLVVLGKDACCNGYLPHQKVGLNIERDHLAMVCVRNKPTDHLIPNGSPMMCCPWLHGHLFHPQPHNLCP